VYHSGSATGVIEIVHLVESMNRDRIPKGRRLTMTR